MANLLPGELHALLTRLIFYFPFGLLMIWVYHLIRPALVATFSPEYRSFNWIIDGKRGVWSFLKSTWNIALKSDETFADIHGKITGADHAKFNLVQMPQSNSGFMLMVPQASLNEYARQPERDISFFRNLVECAQPNYTTLGPHIITHFVYRNVVHKEFYVKLADKIDLVNEEMVISFDKVIASKVGPNGEAKINMWDTANQILSRSANRVISGFPLCRNDKYQNATATYATTWLPTALFAQLIPKILRPLLMPLACVYLTRLIRTATKEALPVIKERMIIIDAAEEKEIEPDLPNDLLSAVILAAKRDSDAASEYDPRTIVARMMTLNFLQSYTNQVTMTNIVYDLVSLPQGDFESMVADLRAEINAELGKGDDFSLAFCQRLSLMDSFMRESIRYNPISETGIERIITKKGGFTFSDGTHVPEGATTAAAMKAYQRDEKNYPGGFNPRRSMDDPKHPKFTDISPILVNFGLGRGGCPGRWYTSCVLKLLLTRLLLDYDFERLDKRPQSVRKLTIEEPSGRFLITLKKRGVK